MSDFLRLKLLWQVYQLFLNDSAPIVPDTRPFLPNKAELPGFWGVEPLVLVTVARIKEFYQIDDQDIEDRCFSFSDHHLLLTIICSEPKLDASTFIIQFCKNKFIQIDLIFIILWNIEYIICLWRRPNWAFLHKLN